MPYALLLAIMLGCSSSEPTLLSRRLLGVAAAARRSAEQFS